MRSTFHRAKTCQTIPRPDAKLDEPQCHPRKAPSTSRPVSENHAVAPDIGKPQQLGLCIGCNGENENAGEYNRDFSKQRNSSLISDCRLPIFKTRTSGKSAIGNRKLAITFTSDF